jgi:glycosyltransferase involved in cell wall biosynthesis
MSAPSVILILSSGPLCRNPRVLKEATALGAAGFDVTVMTVANLPRFEAFDREILKSAPFRKIALDHLAGSPAARVRQIASRLGTWLARRAARLGLQSAQALGPAGALGRMAHAFPADLTIVHTELPLCIGYQLLARGRRVATDFEDWHSRDLLPNAQTTRPVKLIWRVERGLMQRSSYTSTTSHAMAGALHAAHGGVRPVVLTNSFPLQPDPAHVPHAGPPAFFWFSQTIGPGRGLELFLAAWRRTTQPSRCCLLGDIDDAYRMKLISRLPPERRSLLEFLPITSPEELPAVIARHDIGLALEANMPANKDYTISNKILQYLNAGLAVIASSTAGQREVLARAPDAGHIIKLHETGELTQLLDTMLGERARLTLMGAAARRAAEEHYCWENEIPHLVAAVTTALAAPARPVS